MKQTNYARSIFLLLLFISLALFFAILKVSSAVILPLVVSILLSFVFYPFVKNLNRKAHFPWILGVLMVVILAIVVFSIAGNLLVVSIKAIINGLPKYESRFTSIYNVFVDTFKIPVDENSSIFANLWSSNQVRNFVQKFLGNVSNVIISFAKVILVVALFVIFLLLEMKNMKGKVQEAINNEETNKKVLAITAKIISQVTHYISIKFLVSLMTGCLVSLCCLIIGMDFPIVWGFLAFILNFIPNFGSIVSWLVTTVFAVIQFYPGWGKIVFISVAVLAINMTLGSIIEPRWEGSDLGLSPFIILVSLSLWMWIWGFIGAILSVPMMVIIKIVCENIDFLKPVAVIMGNSTSDKKEKKKLFAKMLKKNKNKDSESEEATESTSPAEIQ